MHSDSAAGQLPLPNRNCDASNCGVCAEGRLMILDEIAQMVLAIIAVRQKTNAEETQPYE